MNIDVEQLLSTVVFPLGGEITQVKELIPWVRSASGNIIVLDCTAWYCMVIDCI